MLMPTSGLNRVGESKLPSSPPLRRPMIYPKRYRHQKRFDFFFCLKLETDPKVMKVAGKQRLVCVGADLEATDRRLKGTQIRKTLKTTKLKCTEDKNYERSNRGVDLKEKIKYWGKQILKGVINCCRIFCYQDLNIFLFLFCTFVKSCSNKIICFY